LSALDKGAKPKKEKEASMKSAVKSNDQIRTWVEHTLERSKLEAHLDTKIAKEDGKGPGYQGLTMDQAILRISLVGPNVLSEKKGLPWPIKLLLEFTGLFNYMLWAGGILCFVAYFL
jgi:sodium/potassium-transporting ATPase subunit alpha